MLFVWPGEYLSLMCVLITIHETRSLFSHHHYFFVILSLYTILALVFLFYALPFLRAKLCFHFVSELTCSISQVGISVLFCKIHVISESGVPSVCACVDLCQKGFSVFFFLCMFCGFWCRLWILFWKGGKVVAFWVWFVVVWFGWCELWSDELSWWCLFCCVSGYVCVLMKVAVLRSL